MNRFRTFVIVIFCFALFNGCGGSSDSDSNVGDAVAKYSIGGTVTGLNGEVTLSNNGDQLFCTEDGPFTFETYFSPDDSYDVVIDAQPLGQICTVESNQGTLGSLDVTDIQVDCSTMPVIERVSLSSEGAQGDLHSYKPSVSEHGRYVAFDSSASNLVATDTNNRGDIFVRDRITGETTRVSVATDGTQGNSYSASPAISANGQIVTFRSDATNLVDGDDNSRQDVFAHDRLTGETMLVSVASDGTPGSSSSTINSHSLSRDGRYVAFSSVSYNLVDVDANQNADIFVRDLETGQNTLASVSSDGAQGDGKSHYASISADGNTVVFWSYATNLVDDDTNSAADIFAHDLTTGETTRVSVASDGTQGEGAPLQYRYPVVSGDGRYVAFDLEAYNLVSDDTNGVSDIFVHDRVTGETTRVSVASDGAQGDGYSNNPSISSDGRYVAFHSVATNLVIGDTNGMPDVFVHDRETGETARMSLSATGAEGDFYAQMAGISPDGRYVAFDSAATSLVEDDTNDYVDIFIRER